MGMTAPETSTREAAGAQAAVEPTATDEPTEPEFFDSLFRGMEPPLRTAFIDAMQIIDSNLDQLLREER